MIKLYYTIWIDGIVMMKTQPQNKYTWKFTTQLFMSLSMGMNWGFLYSFLGKWFGFRFHDKLEVDFFPGDRIDYMLSFFLIFMLPPWIINYFLIFYKNRYEKLIERYEFHNGKYFLWYLVLSLGIPFLYMIIFM